MEVAVATSTYVFQVISADSGFLLKIGASIIVTGRDVYGPVVGRWLCNDSWMRLTVTPKGGVKMVASHVWWHHRFLSVAFCMVLPCIWVFTTVHICYVVWFCSYGNKYRLWTMCFW